MYYTATPHIGAGIGHQLGNWSAGYYYAKAFGLKFAHTPFSSIQWEEFLGFGENETLVKDLVQKENYKKRKLPLFSNLQGLDLNKQIISSYKGRKIIFVSEQDQQCTNPIVVYEDIRYKFKNAKHRKYDHLIYSPQNLNVAIHIRRGDIMIGAKVNPVYEERFQKNSYYLNILNKIVTNSNITKPLCLYVFSQGQESDFDDFKIYDNVIFCLDMNPYDSFLHLANADLLLTSKSSFSYYAAFLSDGIRICPAVFCHPYPDNDCWLLADTDGIICEQKLNQALCCKKNELATSDIIAL